MPSEKPPGIITDEEEALMAFGRNCSLIPLASPSSRMSR